jgi:tRNA dimethylallyltransferase
MSTVQSRQPGADPAADRTVVVVGPTASGKSGLALGLAERLISTGRPAEIVNADSMLVYRGMDIGTAKPSAAERARVVHHLVDVLDVTETATVAQFQDRARTAIADCRARGVVPIVVGGSALYIRAIVDDFVFPGTDTAVRGRLEADLAAVGSRALHERLTGLDPTAASVIQPENGRRVVRALEVIELTGEPYPAQLPERRYLLPGVVQIGLALERQVLDRRIEDRVTAMWAAGLVAEVERLSRHGLRDGVTASRALGYRQVLELLDGLVDETEAQRRTVVATRRFARRQDSWFRQDDRIAWLAHDRPDLVDAALAASVATPDGAPGVGD